MSEIYIAQFADISLSRRVADVKTVSRKNEDFALSN